MMKGGTRLKAYNKQEEKLIKEKAYMKRLKAILSE